MLYLNNIPASDVGVIVEHRPRRPLPRRQCLSWDVPGRGRILRQLDAWDNVTLQYELAIVPLPGTSLAATADLAAAWLNQGGYMRLYDDTDPDVFYLAACPGGQDLEPVLHRAREIKVSFDAKPQRFLLSGERETVFSAAGALENPTPYRAKPLITLSGSGEGVLTIAGNNTTLSNCAGAVLDCEACAFSGSGTLSGLFPELAPGSNAVSFSGGITAVKIVPRWYMI